MEDPRSDVDEACCAHHIGEEECGVEVYAEVGERLNYEGPVFGYGVIGRHGIVMAVRVVVNFL